MRYIGQNGASRRAASCWTAVPTSCKNGTRVAAGGTLKVVGAELKVNGTLKLGAGATLIQGGPAPGDRTNVTGNFTLQGPASGADGTWEWQGGTTYASMTLGPKAGLFLTPRHSTSSTGRAAAWASACWRSRRAPRSRRTRPPSISPAGSQNRGTWKVRNGKAATITGNGVTRPFLDYGRLDASGGSLTITNARLELTKDPSLPVAGVLKGGDVVLSDGELVITGGAAIDGGSAVVKLDGGIEVKGGGALTLRNGARVDVRNATVLRHSRSAAPDDGDLGRATCRRPWSSARTSRSASTSRRAHRPASTSRPPTARGSP